MFFGTSVLCAVKLAGASFGLWEICICGAGYCAGGLPDGRDPPALILTRRSPSPLWMFARFEAKKVAPYIPGANGRRILRCRSDLSAVPHNLFADYEQAHQMVRGSRDSLYSGQHLSTYPAAKHQRLLAALVEIVITSMPDWFDYGR